MADFKAGPELNALVAEWVMKWTRLTSPSGDYVPWEDDKRRRHNTHVAARSFAGLMEWSPSTDLATAWEVVEKLRTDNYWIQVGTCDAGWNVQIGRINKLLQHVTVVADTVPLAICLAALKAVGHD